jgi:hypothetical protein
MNRHVAYSLPVGPCLRKLRAAKGLGIRRFLSQQGLARRLELLAVFRSPKALGSWSLSSSAPRSSTSSDSVD